MKKPQHEFCKAAGRVAHQRYIMVTTLFNNFAVTLYLKILFYNLKMSQRVGNTNNRHFFKKRISFIMLFLLCKQAKNLANAFDVFQ